MVCLAETGLPLASDLRGLVFILLTQDEAEVRDIHCKGVVNIVSETVICTIF